MRTTALLVAALSIAGFAAAAAAETASTSPADLAFMESLAESLEDLPELGVPAPQWKVCSASTPCGDGNTVACTGNSICQVTIAGVKCDGVETQCPNFCSIGQNCQCCNGSYSSFCWSRRGDCQYTGGGISCDGHEHTCEHTCPLCPEW